MPRYTTTNVRLSAEAYRDLMLRAARRGVPLAALVRDAVAEYLGRPSIHGAAAPAADPVDALIGSTPFEATDEAMNHDHYLYDWPKEEAGRETAGGHRRSARPVQSAGHAAPAGTTLRAGGRRQPVRDHRVDPGGDGDAAARADRRRTRR
jgi:hypothetical protein